MIFFTSDHHLGHENIIEYCDRPFSSIEEMDNEMIRRWNEKVQPSDKVYHLGDFTLGSREQARHYFSQLNGNICILANRVHHDHRWLPALADRSLHSISSYLNYVNIFPPLVSLEFPELSSGKYSQVIVLCHYPLARWDRRHYGSWHLFGHCHGRFEDMGLAYDVGVDNNDFYPVSLDQVVEIMRRKERILAR